MIEENDKLRPVWRRLMEDVDNESGSQNGLQGIDVDNPAHEEEGTIWRPWRDQGSRGKLIVADVRTTKNRFHNGNY